MLMIGVAAAASLISWGLSAIMIRLSRNVVSKMRKDLFDHLTTLPISFFDTHQTGDVLSILSYDVDTVGATLSTDLTQIISSLVTVVGSFIMMISIAPDARSIETAVNSMTRVGIRLTTSFRPS